jgi:voltage-gated sodium channel
MIHLAAQIVESKAFRSTIIVVILLAGVLAGVETSAALAAGHRPLLRVLDLAVLIIFIAEIALKIIAKGRRPLDYFRDGWNVFDFTIVAACLLPIGGPFAAVLRLVRTLRLLRLVTALPRLQMIVGALLKSLGSMGYVSLLLALIFYIYAIIGIQLFGQQAPAQFGSLPAATLSLFQMITLDAWSDLFHEVNRSAPIASVLYFLSFILLGTMIMLNLFIGVIMSSMAEMHAELDEQKQGVKTFPGDDTAARDLAVIDQQLTELRASFEALQAKLPKSPT